MPTARTTIHVSRLVDGVSETARGETDIVVEGNRIRSVTPHSAAAHRGAVIDGTGLTAMPGLIEFHSHLQKDFGEAQGRAWLAFGVTTVRSPGNTPYEAVEDREANEAAIRPGPRVYGTGYLMEWQRVYYKMGVAISSPAHLEMELERAKVLQHDLIKSYVRLPDLQQKRMVEFAHGIGVPVATHEIFPAALVGVDNTEHTAATSRRGYSPKQTTLQRAYADVVQLFGKSERYWCPMMSGGGVRRIFDADPALRQDPRFALYPEWMQQQVRNPQAGGAPGGGLDSPGNNQMLMEIFKAGRPGRRRHRHAQRGQPARGARRLRERRHDAVPGAARRDRDAGGSAQPRRRADRRRQAGRHRDRRGQPARAHRRRVEGPAGDGQRPRLRDGRTGTGHDDDDRGALRASL